MNAPEPIASGWSRGRFLLVAALLFAGQAGLVLLLGERPGPPPLPAAPGMALRLLDAPLDEEQWTERVFAINPSVFPSSSPHGFAAQAWRLLPVQADAAALEEPPPVFLEFAANWSGADGNPAGWESRHASFQWAGQPGPPPDGVPGLPAAEASRPESFFRIEGALAGRRVAAPGALPSWPANFLVTNSVVQFAVNRSGQVVSAVLLAGSGLKEADDSALATVNVLRFRPAGAAAPEYAWDTATFYWKTTEPPPRPVGPK
jgi:TonB family protein